MLEGPYGMKQEILMRIRKAGLTVDDLDKKKKVEGKRRRGTKLRALRWMRTHGITLEELKNFKRSDIVYPKPRPKNYYKDYVLPALKKHEEEMNKKLEEMNKREEEFLKKREEFLKKLDEENPSWKKLPPSSDSKDSSSSSSDSEDDDDDDSEDEDDMVVDDVEDDSDEEICAIFKKLDDEEAEQQIMRDGVPNKRLRHVPTPPDYDVGEDEDDVDEDEDDVDQDDPDYDEMSAIFKDLDEQEAKRLSHVPNKLRLRCVSPHSQASTSAIAGDDGMQQMVCDAAAAAAGDCTKITALWLSKKRCV